MQITMITSQPGPTGAILQQGNTYPVPDAFGRQLIASGYADDVMTLSESAQEKPVTAKTNPVTGVVELTAGGEVIDVGGGGGSALVTSTQILLSSDDSDAAASSNATKLQAAIDAGGRYAVFCDGVAQISQQLVYKSGVSIDFLGTELKARTAIGSLIVSSAYLAVANPVTITWTSGITASVDWTGHGLVADDHAWLNRADQSAYCGVFRVISVTDANNFVVQLLKVPAVAATGTITGRKANKACSIKNVVLDYNSPTNTGLYNNKHAAVFGGVADLEIDGLLGKNTEKYLLCTGALARYTLKNIGGVKLNSDALKVYGPAFGGIIENIHVTYCGDDLISLQTRETAAYIAYDFCHGDIIGCSINGLSGASNTGSLVLYASPYGVIDGIDINGMADSPSGSAHHMRMETQYTTGVSEIGAVTLNCPSASDKMYSVVIGNGSGTLKIRNLSIISPTYRGQSNSGRLIQLGGTAVTAGINIFGGYFAVADNIVNCVSNTGVVSLGLFGTRLGICYAPFRTSTAGTLDVKMSGVVFEDTPGAMFSAAVGTGVIKVAASGTTLPAGATYAMSAGSLLRLGGDCDIPLDGSVLDATVANHAAGASFYNVNAAFSAGIGKYVRGASTWTRIAT